MNESQKAELWTRINKIISDVAEIADLLILYTSDDKTPLKREIKLKKPAKRM